MLFKGLQHIGIPTEDYEVSLAFYKQLGFELINFEMNQGQKAGFLELGGLVLEIWEAPATESTGAIHHIALDTDDIEGAFAAISRLSVQLIDTEIQQLPFWEKGIKYFNFYGPNRETIEICQKNQ